MLVLIIAAALASQSDLPPIPGDAKRLQELAQAMTACGFQHVRIAHDERPFVWRVFVGQKSATLRQMRCAVLGTRKQPTLTTALRFNDRLGRTYFRTYHEMQAEAAHLKATVWLKEHGLFDKIPSAAAARRDPRAALSSISRVCDAPPPDLKLLHGMTIYPAPRTAPPRTPAPQTPPERAADQRRADCVGAGRTVARFDFVVD
ncbi:hypothetical protein [Sphingomonas immobilis]|uniref:SPOR domain-containing protein n=1 Tax=Sphingomonas immobilis TaxID=3063997 RepID=A0ABT9A1P2_9SPHN|nr:hypothetical protein [Sphingomonas sp. CA1-15]MDO7843750.1 hypothetical protein [Sphingomonas sp. CA1-15]